MKNRVLILLCCVIFKNYMFEKETQENKAIQVARMYLQNWRGCVPIIIGTGKTGKRIIINEEEWEKITEGREPEQIKEVFASYQKLKQRDEKIIKEVSSLNKEIKIEGLWRLDISKFGNKEEEKYYKNDKLETSLVLTFEELLSKVYWETLITSEEARNNVMWRFICKKIGMGRYSGDFLKTAPFIMTEGEFQKLKDKVMNRDLVAPFITTEREFQKLERKVLVMVYKKEWDGITADHTKEELEEVKRRLLEQENGIEKRSCYILIQGVNYNEEMDMATMKKIFKIFKGEINFNHETMIEQVAKIRDDKKAMKDTLWYMICDLLGVEFLDIETDSPKYK